MTVLILVRHGETIWNAEHRYQGQSDIPLSEGGIQQAERVAARLQSEAFDALYVSDLSRAKQTATIINQHHQLEVRSDARLREANMGIFEGLTPDEQRARFPDIYDIWRADPDMPPPQGEPRTDIEARMQAILDHILDAHANQRVLIVGHGGTLRTLMCLCIGLPSHLYWRFWLDNTSITELRFTERGALLYRVNDTAHL